MAKANEWNLRWHCQLHDMKIGQNPSQVPNDFPIFFLFDQMNPKRDTNKGFFSSSITQWKYCSKVTSPINENFPSEQVSYFLK